MKHPVPQAALAHHIVFLGKTGSGKSNGAKVIAEESLDAGERVCVIDPTGAWWGLRLKANGKPSDYPVVIFGGLHADVAIGAGQGAAVAEVIATSATPAVIDTRLMTVGERTRFFTDFAETLLRKNRGPLRLIIDEAHVFAPQGRVADPNSGKMLHAANNLVSLGRSIGLRIIMISQRPAKLHKDSLTQVETLVAMRLIAPQDRGAVEDWIGEWADKGQGKEIISSLPSLPTGDAWVWSPEANFLERVHFPLARTYDSGKAPIAGDAGPELKPLDLAAVNALLDKAGEEIKANDPKHLKAEIARLTRELATASKGAAPPWPDQRDEVQRLRDELASTAAAMERLTASARELERRHKLARAALDGGTGIEEPTAARKALPHAVDYQHNEARVSKRPKPAPVAADSQVPPGTRPTLAVLASVYPAGMTSGQLAARVGIKKKGSTFSAYKSRLRTSGLIEERDGLIFASEAGAAAIGDVAPMPEPGPELARSWAAKLPGTGPVVEYLLEHPGWCERDDIAVALGINPQGSTLSAYVSRLFTAGVISKDGSRIRLSAEVMGK